MQDIDQAWESMSQIRESINFLYLSLNGVPTCRSMFHKKHKLVSSGSHRTMFVHLPLRSFLKASNGLGAVVLVSVCLLSALLLTLPLLCILAELTLVGFFSPGSCVSCCSAGFSHCRDRVGGTPHPPTPRCDSSLSWWPSVLVAPSPPAGPLALGCWRLPV